MAFARGKFGIEYNTAPRREEPGPFVPIILVLVFVAALGSLVWTVYGRLKGDGVERAQAEAAAEESRREAQAAEKKAEKAAEKSVSLAGVSDLARGANRGEPTSVSAVAAGPERVPPAAAPVKERPVQVRNLLRRLEEAEKKHDVEMAVTTIEQLRALPGKPAADLDDALAKRLGTLNVQRLFKMRSPLWVVDVTIGRGDSATRVAVEHGSTFASLVRLNPGTDLGRLRIGQRLKVLNHPSFRLLVTRSSRTADLLLNGKFFKRYYLKDAVKGTVGAYELPERVRPFWGSIGILLDRRDREELETLLPKGSSVILSEI